MTKNFVKRYQRRLMFTHFVTASSIFVLFIILLFVLLFIDSNINGFADSLVNLLGYNLVYSLRTHKEFYLFVLGFIAEFVAWIVVEIRAVRKLANVIDQMELLFSKDDRLISLESEFSEVEANLNALKLDNIKNQQRAEAEAQRKTDLITYLAHDIKTPLASVIGYLSLLEEAPDLPVEQRAKYTKITLDKAYRLETLINEFFDITRFNLSSIPLEKENISLSFMLEQMAEEFYPLLAPRGKSMEIEINESIKVYGDPDKLARVFNNILKNAIAYGYDNSVIHISAVVEAKNISIKFLNHGKEIPPHKLESIFEKFFRLDSARSSNTGGAGLGLAIAKEIVVQHGGNILASSDENGTVFEVILPVK